MQVFSEKHATQARQLFGNLTADSLAAAHSAALQLGEPQVSSLLRCGWKLASKPSFSCWPACFYNEESKHQASFSNVSPLRTHHFCTPKFPL